MYRIFSAAITRYKMDEANIQTEINGGAPLSFDMDDEDKPMFDEGNQRDRYVHAPTRRKHEIRNDEILINNNISHLQDENSLILRDIAVH